jgi:alpha-tubulin suppressor-like RCC1 family protein
VALKGDGTVVQWDVNNPPSVVAGLSNIVAVAAGGEHSAALKADGTVVAWGANFFGQTDVPAGLSNVVDISAAEYHTLALKRDGTLVAWGRLYLGEDVTPPRNLSNVVAIATSASRDVVISVSAGASLDIAANASGAGQVIISLLGAPNKVYAIEASADLVTWDHVQSVSSESGRMSFEVPMGDATMRFFRAK